MKILKDGIAALAEFDEQQDGLALEDRPLGADQAVAVPNGNGECQNPSEAYNGDDTLVGAVCT